MPRFYFDVREGVRFVQDKEGVELPDLDAAQREATDAATLIGRGRFPTGECNFITVEVRNQHKQRVLTATVSLTVNRFHPAPARRLRLVKG